VTSEEIANWKDLCQILDWHIRSNLVVWEQYEKGYFRIFLSDPEAVIRFNKNGYFDFVIISNLAEREYADRPDLLFLEQTQENAFIKELAEKLMNDPSVGFRANAVKYLINKFTTADR